MDSKMNCPDCDVSESSPLTRRGFVQSVGTAAAMASTAGISVTGIPGLASAGEKEKSPAKATPEPLVKKLFETLSESQKKVVCFDWDHKDERGLLRTHVSNNWHITKPTVSSAFFTKDQQDIIEAIFYGLYNPQWHANIRKQLKDDAGGYGKAQNIAIFGEPGSGKFEFVMTGRHLTIRCDGDSTPHMAFGGPIFYGHAAKGFNEAADHPGNVFWYQAQKANALYKMLDGKQQKQALVAKAPDESAVHFRGKFGGFPGLPVTELSKDQKDHVQKVLEALVEPYRAADQEEVSKCLKAQGGLEKCSIAFYQSGDIGNDQVWDNWRLEGPSFVWYFRGAPHVHVWVNIASDPSAKISTKG